MSADQLGKEKDGIHPHARKKIIDCLPSLEVEKFGISKFRNSDGRIFFFFDFLHHYFVSLECGVEKKGCSFQTRVHRLILSAFLGIYHHPPLRLSSPRIHFESTSNRSCTKLRTDRQRGRYRDQSCCSSLGVPCRLIRLHSYHVLYVFNSRFWFSLLVLASVEFHQVGQLRSKFSPSIKTNGSQRYQN